MSAVSQVLFWALPPLLGAAIGYGTNDLAIRMLFRPYRAYTLFGRRVPFTPGMIPKEQTRIAEKVGTTITTHLLTGDEIQRLSRRLVSEENVGALVDRLLDQLGAALAEDRNRALLADKAGEMAATIVADRLPQILERLLARPVDNLGLRGRIVALAVEQLDIGRIFTELVLAVDPGQLIEREREALREPLARLLHGYLDAEIEGLAERALASLDMRGIIVKNVNAFPPERVERIIYELSRKELKGIIYLGGLLGFLVGCVQVALGFWLR